MQFGLFLGNLVGKKGIFEQVSLQLSFWLRYGICTSSVKSSVFFFYASLMFERCFV